ncbi:Replication factor C subunit 1 [Nosema granulosis]|uniref:Replication factor C subunit 1 n=1 Tax=Nosema granulosis TaxID=83296 RepID=A0A9P6L0A8_9MICR|nr:Replication factor C subunit 1 [Nosema granulosis]
MEEEIIFKGKTFVFTGDMSIPRDDAKSKVILLGGRCTTTPSSKTTYLVLGTDPGVSKLKKARDLNIRLVYEDEFMRSLEEELRKSNRTVSVDISISGMCKNSSDVENDTSASCTPISYRNSDNMWSEKYRPTKKAELVGNSSIYKALEDFLSGDSKFKAALLSGPPGLGKTTSAHIICKEMDFDIVEFNASDVRNKSSLIAQVKGIINTLGISTMKKKVVIMDEVDGMSSDRGGLAELATIIKTCSVPLICICNDRNNQKIRTLANYCLDLRFRKLDARQIVPRLKDILRKESKHVEDGVLNELVSVANGDMRYILNTLQNLCVRKTISIQVASDITRKTLAKNTFDVAAEVFQRRSLSEKIDLYFEDYSIIPLFVQENYIKMSFENLSDMYESTESISSGDIVEKMIRGANQEWSLAPLHGFFSVVVPTHKKILHKRIDFPLWLGQNSKSKKHLRYIQETKTHSSTHIDSGIFSFRLFDVNLIFTEFINSLRKENVKEALNQLVELDLLKDDLINLSEVIIGGVQSFKEIKTKTKGELTRTYKKIRRNLPYSISEEPKSEEE